MDDVSLAYARDHLDELLQRAARGEDVRITDPSVGTVRLQAVTAAPATETKPKRRRRLGHLAGKIPPPPADFFDPMSEEKLKLWYGDDP